MKVRTNKTYTQYQLDKILDQMEKDFTNQWEEKVEEIRIKTFDQVKLDMFEQFISIAMATLEKFHDFNEEQLKDFYNNYITLTHMMSANPLGKECTAQDTIDHIEEKVGVNLHTSQKLKKLAQ